MKLIRTEDAVGQVLCHDLTQIIPGVVKGPRFRKGHIVAREDIPVLLSMGKDQLYVWEKDDTVYHENEGAEILCQVCQGENMIPSEVKEGKIELTAACDGLFLVDVERLNAINEIDQVMIATRHSNTPVKKGDKLLGTRVIPLVIKKRKNGAGQKDCRGKTSLPALALPAEKSRDRDYRKRSILWKNSGQIYSCGEEKAGTVRNTGRGAYYCWR